jgi:hypothetical protein
MTSTQHSRGALTWLGATLAGALSAAAFAFAFAHAEAPMVFTFLYSISAIPLFVAGLGTGNKESVFACLTGTGGVYLLSLSPFLAGLYAVLFALPVAIFLSLALRHRAGNDGQLYWYPEGYLLTAIVLYPCLMFLSAAALASGQDGGLLGLSIQVSQTVFATLPEQSDPEKAAVYKTMMDALPQVLPGLFGYGWIFLMLVSALVGQTILKGQNWNLRPAFAWRDTTLPAWLIMAAALTGLAGMLAPAPLDYMASNLCLILFLPFFFLGLAVIHVWAETQKRARIPFLLLFYLLLCIPFVMPLLILAVTLLGALDQGFHIRRRLAAKQSST